MDTKIARILPMNWTVVTVSQSLCLNFVTTAECGSDLCRLHTWKSLTIVACYFQDLKRHLQTFS